MYVLSSPTPYFHTCQTKQTHKYYHTVQDKLIRGHTRNKAMSLIGHVISKSRDTLVTIFILPCGRHARSNLRYTDRRADKDISKNMESCISFPPLIMSSDYIV